jgi:hypothetical protein
VAIKTIAAGAKRMTMTFKCSFLVYMVALVSFVGWFLFSVRPCPHRLCNRDPSNCMQHQVTCKRCPVNVCSIKSSAPRTYKTQRPHC